MIESQHLQVLRRLVARLQDRPLDWVVTGSLGMALQGVPVAVQDVDVQTGQAGAYEIERCFAEYVVQPVRHSQSERIRSHFGVLEIEGVPVEIMGALQKRLDDPTDPGGPVWEPPVQVARHRRWVERGPLRVPVLSLAYEYQAYLKLGRHDKAALLRAWLQKSETGSAGAPGQKLRLNLDPGARATLARQILEALEAATPGSVARLRGSLAGGTADLYSDVDLLWEVPDENFQSAVARLPAILAGLGPVASLRSTPEFQHSDRRRLIFAQFRDVPLFWRIDLDVLARSVGQDYTYDLDNPAARGEDWSRTHSALMNAVAAIKALLRNREAQAEQLLVRGFHRAGHPVPEGAAQEQILKLVQGIAALDPARSDLARRITALHRWAFDPDRDG